MIEASNAKAGEAHSNQRGPKGGKAMVLKKL